MEEMEMAMAGALLVPMGDGGDVDAFALAAGAEDGGGLRGEEAIDLVLNGLCASLGDGAVLLGLAQQRAVQRPHHGSKRHGSRRRCRGGGGSRSGHRWSGHNATGYIRKIQFTQRSGVNVAECNVIGW